MPRARQMPSTASTPALKGDGPRNPRVTVLVAVLASADPGELLTWTQLEELADAALASRMDITRSCRCGRAVGRPVTGPLSLIHISEPTRRTPISYAVFCLKKKK